MLDRGNTTGMILSLSMVDISIGMFFSYEYILSMDIVEEKFYKIPLPRNRENYSVLGIGNNSYVGLELPIGIGAAHVWILIHAKVEEVAKFLWIKRIRNHAGEKEWQKLKGLRIEDGGLYPKIHMMLF